MPDVGQVGIYLDDIGHRAAAGLGLRLEIACMRRSPFLAIGDLAGDEEDRLGAGHLDCLRIHWGS